MKTCFKCGIDKPLDQFYRHRMMADGHLGKCKECAKADARGHWKHSTRYQQRTTAQKRQDRAVKRAWEKRHAVQKTANTAVGNGIRDKRLQIAAACEYCGETEMLQAHHWDYSRPLDVTWLCPRCHRIADMARRQAEKAIRKFA